MQRQSVSFEIFTLRFSKSKHCHHCTTVTIIITDILVIYCAQALILISSMNLSHLILKTNCKVGCFYIHFPDDKNKAHRDFKNLPYKDKW